MAQKISDLDGLESASAGGKPQYHGWKRNLAAGEQDAAADAAGRPEH
ncbi:MAG: hypothetical protein ACLTW9_14040 [Enterocloster sp.]